MPKSTRSKTPIIPQPPSVEETRQDLDQARLRLLEAGHFLLMLSQVESAYEKHDEWSDLPHEDAESNALRIYKSRCAGYNIAFSEHKMTLVAERQEELASDGLEAFDYAVA